MNCHQCFLRAFFKISGFSKQPDKTVIYTWRIKCFWHIFTQRSKNMHTHTLYFCINRQFTKQFQSIGEPTHVRSFISNSLSLIHLSQGNNLLCLGTLLIKKTRIICWRRMGFGELDSFRNSIVVVGSFKHCSDSLSAPCWPLYSVWPPTGPPPFWQWHCSWCCCCCSCCCSGCHSSLLP